MTEISGVHRARLIKTVALIALFGNLVLASLKIVLGILSGSLAVIGDGIDSSVERAIKDRVEGVYDIMVHVEPWGDSLGQKNEGYGLDEARLSGGENTP
jgi:divalent metal cation (Fe/Co/Zn/Cd) transporter